MYSPKEKTNVQKIQDKARALARVKQILVRMLSQLEPDGLLTKDEILTEIEYFKTELNKLAESNAIKDEDEN